MPDESGDIRDDAGLELANWMFDHCFYTSRIVITGLEKIELTKAALASRRVDGYYSKADIAAGQVKGLTQLVADTLANRRLCVLTTKSEMPMLMDRLDLWGKEGVVEKDIHAGGPGVVRFHVGAVMAHLHPSADVAMIRAGERVVGRSVVAGQVEVLPV